MSPSKIAIKHFYRKTWINQQSVYLDFKIQAGFFINQRTFTRKNDGAPILTYFNRILDKHLNQRGN